MSGLVVLNVSFRTVTPLFLGGATPDEFAELRAPSVKGALRFWYRAIDPDYRNNEPSLFGSIDSDQSNSGQSKFLLRWKEPICLQGNEPWKKWKYNGFSEQPEPSNHKKILNGIHYLSFSLTLGENDRKAIPAGRDLTLCVYCRPSFTSFERKGLLAALWLLGHVGGLGARSRRGFGTLALRSWQLEGDRWPELEKLPPAHGAATAEDWLARFEQGRLKLKEWFPAGEEALSDHTHLGTASRFYLLPGCQSKDWTDNKTEKGQIRVYQPWEVALDAAGKVMQEFRQRSNPDYSGVKNYLRNKCKVGSMRVPPKRAAFGLPLTFRYNSLKFNGKTPEVTFQGEYEQHDRSASPLFIRIFEIAGQCHPFFALLEAPLLAPSEKIKDSKRDKNTWTPPGRSLLLKFCDTELSPKAIGELRCDRQL